MPEEKEKNDHGKILMSWNFPEYIRYQRTAGWYLGAAVLVLGLLLYAFFTSNFLFALIIIMMSAIIIIYNLKKPLQIKFSVMEDGLEVGTKFYPWSDFNNFWIIYEPPEIKTLYFDFKGLRPTMPIYFEDQNPVKVREILLKYLKENLTREHEPAGDELSRWLKI
jgi:hypothetical protein